MKVIGTDEMEEEKFVLLYSKCVPYIKITHFLENIFENGSKETFHKDS